MIAQHAAHPTADPSEIYRRIVELDRMCATLGATMDLKLVPGHAWAWDRHQRKVMYPRAELTEMDETQAVGTLWRTTKHALVSHGKLDPYSVAVDAAMDVRDALDIRCVHPRWLLPAMMRAEQERVEHLLRREVLYLGQTFLPRRGTAHRALEATSDFIAISQPITNDPKTYWSAASYAIGALLSEECTAEGLPSSLNWDAQLVEQLMPLREARSFDAMLTTFEGLVPELARRYLETLEEESEQSDDPSDPGDGDDGSDDGNEASQPSSDDSEDDARDPDAATQQKNGDLQSSKAGAGSPSAPATPAVSNDDRAAIESAVEGEKEAVATIDFANAKVVDASDAPSTNYAAAMADKLITGGFEAPLWDAVSRSNTGLTDPLRRTLLAELAENDIGAVERRTPSGVFDARAAAAPPWPPPMPFRRRIALDDQSHAIALLIDRSGSTSGTTDEPPSPETFGVEISQRWHLSTRMVVAFSEAILRIPNSSLAIATFDDTGEVIKALREPLDTNKKRQVMESLIPQGGTKASAGLETALQLVANSPQPNRIIFVLTDGEFDQYDAPGITGALAAARKANTQVVVFTLGCGPESARAFVGDENADEVSPQTAAAVMRRHLKRFARSSHTSGRH